MTAKQFAATLDQLGMSGPGLARLFGVHAATVRRWAQHGCHDTRTIVLLRLLLDGRITVADVVKRQ
jgi:hypothetical protein